LDTTSLSPTQPVPLEIFFKKAFNKEVHIPDNPVWAERGRIINNINDVLNDAKCYPMAYRHFKEFLKQHINHKPKAILAEWTEIAKHSDATSSICCIQAPRYFESVAFFKGQVFHQEFQDEIHYSVLCHQEEKDET